VRLALYQPDIPQNLGAAIRVAACFGAALDIIEPCGFPLTDKALKRAALDYQAATTRHASWAAFLAAPERRAGRLILLTTAGDAPLAGYAFDAGDTLLMGRESAGVPAEVHAAAQARLRIAIEGRSLNLAVSAGIALYEATRRVSA
jgi:tRNA (cytidine/uridine-2'-O-)-methyltransferase